MTNSDDIAYYKEWCERLGSENTTYFKFAFKNLALMLLDEDPKVRELGQNIARLTKGMDLKLALSIRDVWRDFT